MVEADANKPGVEHAIGEAREGGQVAEEMRYQMQGKSRLEK